MGKIILVFGLIAGGILAAMMLLTIPFMDRIGFDRGAVIGYTSMVLAFLMVFAGIKAYRDNVAGGTVSFGRAFKVGLLITLVATVCYVATWEVIFYKLAPDWGEKYAAYTVEKASRSGAREARIAEERRKTEAWLQSYRNPLVNVAFTLLEPLPVGLVFTLVAAGILSRKPRLQPAT